MKKTGLIGFLLATSWCLLAQEPIQPTIDLQEFTESLFQIQDDNINYEELYESLLLLYTTPLNINRATRDELAALYLLSPTQINSLLHYRAQFGDLLSLYELQAVPHFDTETIRSLLPFVTVKIGDAHGTSGPLIQRILQEQNNYLLLRTEHSLQQQKGYRPPENTNDSRYTGSPLKLYGRFRTSHPNDFSLGLTFEKDAGEPIRWKPKNHQYGLDYYSFHFMKENIGAFRKVIIGDYQLQFGQGLILGAGFNPGKGAETITTVRRSSTGIRAYSSALESGFMRGTAATYHAGDIDITAFYSRMRQDGSLQNDSTYTDFDEYVSSIQQTGFHRTPNELNNRKQIQEQNYGLNLYYNKAGSNLRGGITYLSTAFSSPLFKKPNNYNQFEFRGKSNYNAGAFFDLNWENFLFFGEGAVSKSGGLGMIGGLIGSLSPTLSVSLLLRNYHKDFHAFYGNAFGESSRNINESGIYWGLKFAPSKKYTFTAYYDSFRFPWLKFRTESPSRGYEYLARLTYRPKRSVSLYAQYRTEAKQLTPSTEGSNLKTLQNGLKRSYLFNIDYQVTPNLSLKSRVQFSNYQLTSTKTSGMAIAQDVVFSISKFKVSSRIALVDTDDFENRQYLYEKNVLYAFSIKGISGQAIRSYLMVQYKPSKKINVWVRYADTTFQNSRGSISTEGSTIGSGLSEIAGSTRSDIIAQVRYRF